MFTLKSVYSLMFFIVPSLQGYWWTVGNIDMKKISPQTLMTLHKFTGLQRTLIANTPKLLPVAGKGASMAIQECKKQFENRRWNCANYSSESVFGKVLNIACRETAFIHAITSAGVTYALIESCASGFMKRCHCSAESGKGTRVNNSWIYDGCTESVRFGYQRGKHFVDAKETSRDFKSIVNLHNNEAGRLAVLDSMKIKCKCHGLSGACNVQTCRKVLPTFRQVGYLLKEKYNTASKVVPVQITGSRRITRNNLGPSSSIHLKPTLKDLVYFEESPNFCVPSISEGSLGTQGRYCNASLRAKGVNGCELLCCGRSWKTKILKRVENCKCLFEYCCTVSCQKCTVTREYSTCL
ncbi:protein Wnt-1-like [Hydractinia symbiolongicarpus]|nr:protein Wnt-1-like [Hydractinia symbiolongicarpus]